MKTIYVFGSINADMTVVSSRFPTLGETITGEEFSTANGGKGANQAVACARLGGKVKMCGCVGNDIFGRNLTGSLEADGIDTAHICIKETSTGVAVITLVDGDNTIIVSRGANALVTRGQIESFLADAAEGDILLTQLETDYDCVKYALELAKEKQMFTVLNPAPAISKAAELCSLCDCIIPNETELKCLTGCDNPEEGLRALEAMGCRIPIVTLGSEGCAYIADNEFLSKQCGRVKAVDTTGAGDTFCGALCSKLSGSADIHSAVDFALKAATLSVTKKGAQPSIPYLKDIL